ncbi:MAG TPA: iron-sulfur cluster repair di-iron protein [Terriglobales bacterium]
MSIATTETVGNIVAEKPAAAREFETLGIDYCCGGKRTLAEACAEARIGVDEVLARLERSLAAKPAADEKNWQNEKLSALIAHIMNTHHVFVRSECPRIASLTAKVEAAHAARHPELTGVRTTFIGLANELNAHLMKEEQILFPYLQRMEESVLAGAGVPPAMFGTVVNPIRMMMQEHDGAGDALRNLRVLTGDYKLPEDACASYRALFDALAGFEADLHQHIHLENNILFPRAAEMESKR